MFGGFLRQAGHDVTLLGRAPHLSAIDAQGLSIDGIWGDHNVRGLRCATDPAALNGVFDAVLLTVKSFDTESMIRATEHLVAPDGFAISLQNGLGNVETVESVVGPERTLGARVIFGAEIRAPGQVHVSVIADPNAVGTLHPRANATREQGARFWASEFDRAGVPSGYTDSLSARLWAKVLYNAALNPLGALLGVHYGALTESSESIAIMDATIDEAYTVASADGAALPWGSAGEYRDEFYERLVPATFDHRPSMLQDLEAGRRTEIEAINGAVVRRGASYGIAVPVNTTLVRLIRLRQGSH